MFRHLAGTALIFVLSAISSWTAPKSSSKKPPLVVSHSTASSTSAQTSNRLDTAFIHKTYVDGDFDLAIELIEDAQRYGGPFSHHDSVFIFKHLGVMHAAKYETREKGKAYMMQLLNVEPTAKIMDMYASDMIYMIFKNIKDEFDSSRPLAQPESTPRPHPIDSTRPDPSRKEKSYAWVGWTAGAAAVLGGAALTVHLLSEEEPSRKGYTSRD